MEPDEFRQWRKSLSWKQKDAAERLGLKKRVIQYYEKGDRDGKAVAIPTAVELACLALALGHDAWSGEIAARAIESRSAAPALHDDSPLEAVAALDGAPSTDEAAATAETFADSGADSESAAESGSADGGHPNHSGS